MRPAPPPLDPAQYLNAHRLMTLKLDLRSHASRNTTRQTRRRSSDAYGPRPEIAESLRLLSAEIPVLRRSSAETGLISSADLRRTTKIPVAAIVVSESRTAGSLSGRSFRPWI